MYYPHTHQPTTNYGVFWNVVVCPSVDNFVQYNSHVQYWSDFNETLWSVPQVVEHWCSNSYILWELCPLLASIVLPHTTNIIVSLSYYIQTVMTEDSVLERRALTQKTGKHHSVNTNKLILLINSPEVQFVSGMICQSSYSHNWQLTILCWLYKLLILILGRRTCRRTTLPYLDLTESSWQVSHVK